MTTLTVELDENVLARSQMLAEKQGTTIGEMVQRFVRVLARPALRRDELPPVTRSSMGISPAMTDDEVEQAIYVSRCPGSDSDDL